MSRLKNTRFPLLELIDLYERAKDCDLRDWGGNAHAEPCFDELLDHCELSYGGRYKNLLYRAKICFTYYYN